MAARGSSDRGRPQRERVDAPPDVETRDKVAFLRAPAAYPAAVADVQAIETHMSWVFLAGDRAYKLKKPVTYPFLDFSTLAAREADCRAEVRLNRRLAPDVYLGVVPLALAGDGALALAGEGQPVDWLVEMVRLPADRMLDAAIESGTATRERLEAVADLLARFYRRADAADLPAEDYLGHFAREQSRNRAILLDPQFALPEASTTAVLDGLDQILSREPELLLERPRTGCVVDGHGDLRPEHVCLSEPPVVIDCLEFNRTFRLVDPFDELGFLAMECERLGAAWIGDVLIESCATLLGGRPPDRLLAFYVCYRACLRARLSLAHLLEPDVREPEKWRPQARTYLALAERAAVRLRLPAG